MHHRYAERKSSATDPATMIHSQRCTHAHMEGKSSQSFHRFSWQTTLRRAAENVTAREASFVCSECSNGDVCTVWERHTHSHTPVWEHCVQIMRVKESVVIENMIWLRFIGQVSTYKQGISLWFNSAFNVQNTQNRIKCKINRLKIEVCVRCNVGDD